LGSQKKREGKRNRGRVKHAGANLSAFPGEPTFPSGIVFVGGGGEREQSAELSQIPLTLASEADIDRGC